MYVYINPIIIQQFNFIIVLTQCAQVYLHDILKMAIKYYIMFPIENILCNCCFFLIFTISHCIKLPTFRYKSTIIRSGKKFKISYQNHEHGFYHLYYMNSQSHVTNGNEKLINCTRIHHNLLKCKANI